MRRLTSTTVAAACSALLAGCGGSPEAAPAPTPSPSTSEASPSASATPEPPAFPSSARGQTKRAAVEYVKYYVEALNHASRTGDTSIARRLDDGQCQSCAGVFDTIDEVYRAGGTINGGRWNPSIISTLKSGAGWVVDAEVTFAPQTIQRTRGAEPEEFTGGEGLLSFVLKPSRDGLTLDEWTRAS